MKKTMLFSIGLVLVMCLVGFVEAGTLYVDGDYGNNSVDNNCSNESNPCETISYAIEQTNDSGDTIYIAEGTYNETEVVNETADEVISESDGESVVDRGRALVADAVSRLRDGDRDVVVPLSAAGGILVLFLISVYQGGLPGTAYFKRAAVLHKRAQEAHLNGNHEKAKELYNKSYSLREKGENRVFRRAGHGAI